MQCKQRKQAQHWIHDKANMFLILNSCKSLFILLKMNITVRDSDLKGMNENKRY